MTKYNSDSGEMIFSEIEEDEISIAEDNLISLKQIKYDFFSLMDAIKKHTTISKDDYLETLVFIEETINDALYKDWHEQSELAYSSEGLPISKEYIKYKTNTEVANQNIEASGISCDDFLEVLNKSSVGIL